MNQSAKFEFKAGEFSGPLDLLLSLIESEKLDITKISLADVADSFMDHVKSMNDANAEELSDFLDIASRLILIKSKVLLPQLVLTEDEQQDIDELERKLKEYQVFKRISRELEEHTKTPKRGFSRSTKSTPEITLFDPPSSVDQNVLFDILRKVLERVPEEEKTKEHDAKIEPSVSMEEKIDEIDKYFSASSKISFSKFLSKAKTKTEVIVSFLAILELLRLKKVDVQQVENFSDIEIIKKEEELTIKR